MGIHVRAEDFPPKPEAETKKEYIERRLRLSLDRQMKDVIAHLVDPNLEDGVYNHMRIDVYARPAV